MSTLRSNPNNSRKPSVGSNLRRPLKKGKNRYYCNSCGCRADHLLVINGTDGKRWVLASKCDTHIKIIFNDTFCYSPNKLHVIGIRSDSQIHWYECECDIGKSHYQDKQEPELSSQEEVER